MRTEECRCWTGLLAVQTLQLKNIRRIMKQKKNLFQTRMREYCCSSSAAALLGSQIFTDYRGKTRGRFCAPHSNEQIWGFFLKVVHFLILNIRWVSIVDKNRFMISANHYIPFFTYLKVAHHDKTNGIGAARHQSAGVDPASVAVFDHLGVAQKAHHHNCWKQI